MTKSSSQIIATSTDDAAETKQSVGDEILLYKKILQSALDRAKSYKNEGDIDKAISAYEKAVVFLRSCHKKDPKSVEEIYLPTYFALIELMDEKLEEKPDDLNLAKKLVEHALGIDLFEGKKTLEEEIDSLKAAFRRANALRKLGYWQHARSIYINCGNELTKLNLDWGLMLFSSLAQLTADHTLEGRFYLFGYKFLSKHPEKSDAFEFTETERQDLIRIINEALTTKTETFLIPDLLNFLRDPRVTNLANSIQNEIKKLNARHYVLSTQAEGNLALEAIYNNSSSIFEDDETIFRLPRYKNDKCIGYSFYRGTFIGEGGQSTVYKLVEDKELSSVKNSPNTPPLVVKVFIPEAFNYIELELASRYSYIEPAIQGITGSVLVPMQNLGEMNLENFLRSPSFYELNYLQRLTLRAQISCEFNLIHHNTHSTGPALIHNDVKHPNIMVSYANGQTDVRIIDFGHAEETIDDPTKLYKTSGLRGTQGLIAPEKYKSSVGLKSDIVSQAAVSASCIGAINPVKDKYAVYKQFKHVDLNYDLSSIEYNLQGITDGNPAFLQHMKPYEEAFLKRMQMGDYAARPDPDEVLCWDITTRLYAQLKTKRHDNEVGCEYDDELKIYEAKLILLSKGLWRTEIGKRIIPDKPPQTEVDKNSEIKGQEVTKTCAQYDFGAQPLIARAIVKAEAEGELSVERLKQLMQYTPAALHQAVAIVTEKKFDENEMKQEVSGNETEKFNSYKLPRALLNLFIPINPNFDLTKSQQWMTYNLIHEQRQELITLFGEEKVKLVSDRVTHMLVGNLTEYKAKKSNYGKKSSYEKMKKSLGDAVGAHTTAEKENAANVLITAIKDHNFKPLLTQPKVLAALQQGKLAEDAAPAINNFLWKTPGAA